jgi:hypothetical protein
MWRFGKPGEHRSQLPSDAQVGAVVDIVVGERDLGCWFASARLSDGNAVRLAASSREEAQQCAEAFAAEVRQRCGKTMAVRTE